LEDRQRKITQDLPPRRRLNSDISDSILHSTQDISGRNISIQSIYGPKTSDETGQKSHKIVPPPASLTSEMNERKPSANSQVQMVSFLSKVALTLECSSVAKNATTWGGFVIKKSSEIFTR
jgi:hypothetical protein